MSPPCIRCAATRTLNLDTAQRIGTVGSSLVGGAVGAWRATAMPGTLSNVASRFALAKLPAAMMGAIAGSQAGTQIASSLFAQWLPPGDGTPWLCLACGHCVRRPRPPLAAAH
jgi:hypothetical protein